MTYYPSWGELKVSTVLVGTHTFVGRVIKSVSKILFKGRKYPSIWNHEAKLFEFENGPSWIFESLVGKGVRFTPYDRLRRRRNTYYFVHPLDVDTEAAARMWTFAVNHDGESYSMMRNLFLFFWLAGSRNPPPVWLSGNNMDKHNCSELSRMVGRVGGVNEGALNTAFPEGSWYRIHPFPSSVVFPSGSIPSEGEITRQMMKVPSTTT